jgi:hypothetical protein
MSANRPSRGASIGGPDLQDCSRPDVWFRAKVEPGPRRGSFLIDSLESMSALFSPSGSSTRRLASMRQHRRRSEPSPWVISITARTKIRARPLAAKYRLRPERACSPGCFSSASRREASHLRPSRGSHIRLATDRRPAWLRAAGSRPSKGPVPAHGPLLWRSRTASRTAFSRGCSAI